MQQAWSAPRSLSHQVTPPPCSTSPSTRPPCRRKERPREGRAGQEGRVHPYKLAKEGSTRSWLHTGYGPAALCCVCLHTTFVGPYVTRPGPAVAPCVCGTPLRRAGGALLRS
jgi:hypothetical protein